MSATGHRTRLTVKAIAAAKPAAREYTLWDTQLAHFGIRVLPSGVKSYILQTRVNGRMRKITLGRFPELPLDAARREGASVLSRLWGGEDVTPPRKKMSPLFRTFAARYRERRRHRWKPSTLETFDIYLRNRLMPHFGRLRLDAIDHACVSAWFDAGSVDKPGAANRAFEILRAMLVSARQWGELADHVPNACANIVKNRRRPVARYLDHAELQRLGHVLDRHGQEHPWQVATIRLLTLTGARLSEILNLKWRDIGELAENGTSVRIEDSKTGPRTIWFGPEAANRLAELPRDKGAVRVFPETLTTDRLYSFWVRIRDQAGMPGLRIHDCRHTWASQGVMNGVGLTTVGRLLGHRQRETTAIYAHLDDHALHEAAAQAATVIAAAMGYTATQPALPQETAHTGNTVVAPAPDLSSGDARRPDCNPRNGLSCNGNDDTGTEFGAAFYSLQNDWTWGLMRINEFRELFGRAEDVELLNAITGGGLTWDIQSIFWDDLVLRVCRLTDPPSSGGKQNLSVTRLPEFCEDKKPALCDEVRRCVDTAVEKAKFARDRRNRLISHTDWARAMAPSDPLAPATLKQIASALDAVHAVLNAVSRGLLNTGIANRVDVPPRARAFLCYARQLADSVKFIDTLIETDGTTSVTDCAVASAFLRRLGCEPTMARVDNIIELREAARRFA